MVETAGELPPLPPGSAEPPANPDLPAEPLAELAHNPRLKEVKAWAKVVLSVIVRFYAIISKELPSLYLLCRDRTFSVV